MSESEKPVAEGRISKQGNITVAHHQAGQCYFRPDTEEIVFIADSQAGAFETHWRDMLMRMDDYHRAKGVYSSALQSYAQAYSKGQHPSDQAVTKAEDDLAEQRKKVQETLGAFSTTGMSYNDVVELLPIADTRRRGGKGKGGKALGQRYVYARRGYYDSQAEGGKLHRVSLKGKDKQSAPDSIFRKDKHGNTRIDTAKLRQQLTTLEWPKLRLELKDVAKWTGLDQYFDPEAWNEDVTLFDWAEAWNENLQAHAKLGPNVDVSAAAQVMRYVQNVGALAEFDPGKGIATIKGEAAGSLALASGVAQATLYVPDRLGWSLSYQHGGEGRRVFEMGMLRLYLDAQLIGFIGASVQLEGQLQVVTKGDQQLLAGQPGGRLPRFRERRAGRKAFHQQMEAQDEGLQLTGEAFAGARGEASLKGGVQWLKPAEPGRAGNILASSGEFQDFCVITPSIAGLAGAAAGGKFYCTFINGKFCFHIAASLCWGLGAKGGLIGEVGVNTIVEFGGWLVYQLYRLDYGFFDLVDEEAFKTFSRYCVMQMEDIQSNLYQTYENLTFSVVDVGRRFNSFITAISDQSNKNLEASKRRNRLARNINAHHQDLLHYTPEAKGILLYLLTRHGTWDHLDLDNRGTGLVPDIYQERKEAVIWVLRSLQTRREWDKVLCRMTADGSSLASGGNEAAVVEQQRRQLVDFLQEGFNRDADLYQAERELTAVYNRLKIDVAWGYALAMNHTDYYRLNTGPNPHYPQRCTFGPCDADPTHLA